MRKIKPSIVIECRFDFYTYVVSEVSGWLDDLAKVLEFGRFRRFDVILYDIWSILRFFGLVGFYFGCYLI